MELNGKVIDFLGDSITEGAGVANIDNRYDNVLKKELSLRAVYNYGIGGTRIAHQEKASEKPRHDMNFCARAYDLNKEADIIVVFGGTNDYGHGDAPFGKGEDVKPNTYCGAVYFLMQFLKSEYTDKTIVFMTPARRIGDEKAAVHSYKKEDAKPLKEYVDVMCEIGRRLDIPVLNLYENLGINPNEKSDYEKYTVDGLHFNDEGHQVLAKCLKSFLKSL